MTVLLIRANRNQADAAALSKLGIQTRTDSYLNISAVENQSGALRMLSALEAPGPKWLIATSTNVLSYWSELLPAGELERAIQRHDIHFAAIGSQTSAQLLELGADEVLVPRVNNGRSLAEEIALTKPMTVVLPAGSIAMQDIPNRLTQAGFEVITEVVYRTEPVTDQPASVLEIAQGDLTAVLFRSPSAVRAFLEFNPRPNLALFCAGRTTSRELAKFGLTADLVSEDPSPEAVALEISRHFEARG
jgi:uroporphyrinogen-III synthase